MILHKTEKFIIIGRSRLFCEQPIALNTPFVESLTSYISRLAEIHCVTTGTIISKEITPMIDKSYMNKSAKGGGNSFYDTSHPINGIGSMAEEFIQVVQKLTLREDLQYCTLFTWQNVFPTRGLLRTIKAWCPVCFHEWKAQDKPIYEPLIWFIQQVDVCPIHNIVLTKKCPHCTQEVPILNRRTRPGYCSQCSQWLGRSIEELNTLDEEQIWWELWKIKNIGELLAASPTNPTILERFRISEILNKAVQDCFQGKAATLADMIDVPKSTFHGWYKAQQIPPLSSLLKICFCLGVSLKQMLIEPTSKINFNPQSFPEHIENEVISNKNNNSNCKQSIEQQLKHWVESNNKPPPSVREVATILGCDRKLLYKKAPELCKIISQKYYEYIQGQSQKRLEIVESI